MSKQLYSVSYEKRSMTGLMIDSTDLYVFRSYNKAVDFGLQYLLENFGIQMRKPPGRYVEGKGELNYTRFGADSHYICIKGLELAEEVKEDGN